MNYISSLHNIHLILSVKSWIWWYHILGLLEQLIQWLIPESCIQSSWWNVTRNFWILAVCFLGTSEPCLQVIAKKSCTCVKKCFQDKTSILKFLQKKCIHSVSYLSFWHISQQFHPWLRWFIVQTLDNNPLLWSDIFTPTTNLGLNPDACCFTIRRIYVQWFQICKTLIP